jgi:hypothetical protein
MRATLDDARMSIAIGFFQNFNDEQHEMST